MAYLQSQIDRLSEFKLEKLKQLKQAEELALVKKDRDLSNILDKGSTNWQALANKKIKEALQAETDSKRKKKKKKDQLFLKSIIQDDIDNYYFESEDEEKYFSDTDYDLPINHSF